VGQHYHPSDSAQGTAERTNLGRQPTLACGPPARGRGLWGWPVAADTTTCLGPLAFCAGATVDATRKRNGRHAMARADRLAVAPDLDMRPYWRPTRERYLGKESKRHIRAAVAAAAGGARARALEGLNALALMAEPILAEASRLAELLRMAAELR
jgi:ParB family chromosome partitioning protein